MLNVQVLSKYRKNILVFVYHFLIIFILMIFNCKLVNTEVELYSGCRVLNLYPTTQEQVEYLQFLENSKTIGNVRFWNPATNIGTMVVLDVGAKEFECLQHEFEKRNLTFKISMFDLQGRINKEQQENLPLYPNITTDDESKFNIFDMDRYHPLEEIYAYLNKLKSPRRRTKVNVRKFGQSVENRPLLVVEIKKILSIDPKRPLIVIDAGIHAREWISPATALYIISKLMDKEKDEIEERMMRDFDWLIIPVFNPDGYSFTWTNERLWRKNRRIFFPDKLYNNPCNGVDLNRNFDVGRHTLSDNATREMCSNKYGGPSAFSEPETQAFHDLMLSVQPRIRLYISFHNFAQKLLTPYHYKKAYPENYDDLKAMASKATRAMESVNGVPYQYGPGIFLMYPALGTSADWFYENLNISYSFILELPDKGEFAFLLPRDRILPVGQEVWAGLKVLVSELPY